MSSRICITIKPGQRSALDRISAESGAPLAELVRRAVDSFVAARFAGRDRSLVRPGLEPEESEPSCSTPPR